MKSNTNRPHLGVGVYPDFMADKPEIDPVRRGLGMRLASARQNKGFTQQDIAARFSLNKATVSAWETGRGIPDALTLRDLAKLYDVSADGLLWEDSLSPEAMKFAAAFDGLNEQQKRTLNAIWMAYIQESASDAQVEELMAITRTPPESRASPLHASARPRETTESSSNVHIDTEMTPGKGFRGTGTVRPPIQKDRRNGTVSQLADQSPKKGSR